MVFFVNRTNTWFGSQVNTLAANASTVQSSRGRIQRKTERTTVFFFIILLSLPFPLPISVTTFIRPCPTLPHYPLAQNTCHPTFIRSAFRHQFRAQLGSYDTVQAVMEEGIHV